MGGGYELCLGTVSIIDLVDWDMTKRAPRKTAESTGKFPPTPTLRTAKREQSATSLGDAPAAVAKTPVMKSVRLKHHLHSALSCERLYTHGKRD